VPLRRGYEARRTKAPFFVKIEVNQNYALDGPHTRIFAICPTMIPTDPAAPVTITVSPFVGVQISHRPWYAVTLKNARKTYRNEATAKNIAANSNSKHKIS